VLANALRAAGAPDAEVEHRRDGGAGRADAAERLITVIVHEPPLLDAVALTAALRSYGQGAGQGRGFEPASEAPILVVVDAAGGAERAAALAAGAADTVGAPCYEIDVLARVRNLVRARLAEIALERHKRWASVQLGRVRAELEASQEEIILRLSRAGEYRDQETGEHIVRMARYCELIGLELGFPADTCRFLYLAAQMHDVGKIGVPDAVLQKSGPLDPEERAVIERHTLIGRQILSGSASPLIQAAEIVAATHHERWDGTGYPEGLKGDEIPIAGRIAAVADVFDALTSARAYKPAWSLADAREALIRERGRHFDPDCVDAFLRRWREVVAVARANDGAAAAE
jgi:putative two-component system response regulator